MSGSSGLIAVTGAAGMLGREIFGAAERRSVEIVGWDQPDFDVTDRAAVLRAIGAAKPRAVVHAAAWTDVDGCEADPDRALLVNGTGTAHVAEACREVGARLVVLSTDYVFSGESSEPYGESDPPAPLSAYGRSKVAAEEAALALGANGVVARTAWLYANHGKNFFLTMLHLADGSGEIRVVDDQCGSPTFAGDVAPRLLDLAAGEASGVFHLTNAGWVSWHGFAERIFAAVGRTRPVHAVTTAEFARPAPRPRWSMLADTRLAGVGVEPMPPWEDALARCAERLTREPRDTPRG
jgi:dTDP-4-dehydrorhamnose reductase